MRGLVAHLRATGQLTAGLILRALLSGNHELFDHALAELSGLPLSRVVALVHDRGGASLRALLTRAGLPESTFPAFCAALEARDEIGFVGTVGGATRLRRRMVERVLTMCETAPTEVSEPLLILLRRFATESAREEARVFCDDLVAEKTAEAILDETPAYEAELPDLELCEAEIRENFSEPVPARPRFLDRFAFKSRRDNPGIDEAAREEVVPYEAEAFDAEPFAAEPFAVEPCEAPPCTAELHDAEFYTVESYEPERIEPRFDEPALCEPAFRKPSFDEPRDPPRPYREPLLSDLLAAA
jgi:hypothetical protein